MTAGESIIRAGIAGAGVFGSYHAQKFAALDGVDLTAVFDVDVERAGALASTYNAKPYSDYEQFLKHIDVLSVVAPADVHFELAIAALSKGIHCLVEKPIAMTKGEAQLLIDASKLSNAVLQVGHQERFVAEAAGLFANTQKLRRASFRRMCAPSGRCEEVSATLDLMIHDLDLARQLGFGEPVRVEAYGDHQETEAVLWFTDGRRLDFAASRRATTQDRSVVLLTDKDEITFDFVTKRGSDGRCADIEDPLAHGVLKFIGAVKGNNTVVISGEAGRDAVHWATLIEEARLESDSRLETEKEAVA